MLGVWGDVLDDIDGDGVEDLVLTSGTPGTTNGYPSLGRIHVFSGVSGAVLQNIENPGIGLPPVGGSYQAFGLDLAAIGDIDGDGHVDFAAGRSPGPLFVYTHDIVSLAPNPVPLGSTATFSFSVPAQPGATFHLLLAQTASVGVPIGTRTFPLDPDAVLLMTLENPFLGGSLDSSGNAVVSIPVPPVPVLSGLQLQYAGVTLSPLSPFGVRTIGNAKPVAIQ